MSLFFQVCCPVFILHTMAKPEPQRPSVMKATLMLMLSFPVCYATHVTLVPGSPGQPLGMFSSMGLTHLFRRRR